MKQNSHYIAIKIGCNFFYYEFFPFIRLQVIYFSNVLKIIRNNRRSNTSSSKLTKGDSMTNLSMSYWVNLLQKGTLKDYY